MNTAKNDVFIELRPEYCYLVGEISLWWWRKIKIWWWWRGWESTWRGGRFFLVGEWANVWLVRGLPQQGKSCRLLCYSAVGTCNIGEFTFDTHLKTGKQRHDSNQGTKQMCWLKIQQNTFFFNTILWFRMSNAFCKLIRIILLWPFVLDPNRCRWLWLKIKEPI